MIYASSLLTKQQVFLPQSKLKAFADDKINVTQKLEFGLGRVKNIVGKVGWLVGLRFNAILTAKIISWRSVMHMCFLAFSHQY